MHRTKSLTPAHLTPRTLGGCDDPDCVVPLCWLHHRAYDTGRLELLPYLEPRWRAEVAHAVLHLGLGEAMTEPMLLPCCVTLADGTVAADQGSAGSNGRAVDAQEGQYAA